MADTVINITENRRIRNTLGIPVTPKTWQQIMSEEVTKALREFKNK